jgi:hypothetical protein
MRNRMVIPLSSFPSPSYCTHLPNGIPGIEWNRNYAEFHPILGWSQTGMRPNSRNSALACHSSHPLPHPHTHTLHISFKKESFSSLKKLKLLFLNVIYRKVKRRGNCLWYNKGLRLQLRLSCIFQSDSTPKVDLVRETFDNRLKTLISMRKHP